MSVVTYSLGKGLREPCSPFREAYVFGAMLNDVHADGWNCLPVIVDPATTYDLSTIIINHEVLVALANLSNPTPGAYNFQWKWIRERDNKTIAEWPWPVTIGAGQNLYGFCVIGWTNWEISENGAYRCELAITGAETHSHTFNFTVTGIPEKPPEPPLPAVFMNWLIEHFAASASFFYTLYIITGDWVWPFNRVAEWFNVLGWAFDQIVYYMLDFKDWVLRVSEDIVEFLTELDIMALFDPVIQAANSAWDWVSHASTNVWSIVEGWWQATSSTVQGWIDIATQGLDALKVAWSDFWNTTWPQWTAQFNTLSAAWTNFWTVTFPTLVDFSWLWTWWNARLQDINNLVNTAFTLREKLWEGWQELRNQVTEFFSDPEDWLYKAVDRIIERFW